VKVIRVMSCAKYSKKFSGNISDYLNGYFRESLLKYKN